MLDSATSRRTDHTVMTRDMAGDATDRGTFQTPLCTCHSWKGRQRCTETENNKNFAHMNSC